MKYINKMWGLFNKETGRLEGPKDKTPWIYPSREDARDGKYFMRNSSNLRVEKIIVTVERKKLV